MPRGWRREASKEPYTLIPSRLCVCKHSNCALINAQGIMLSVLGHDYFLSYNRIPWMQDAPIRSVLNVQMSGPEAIEWPDLDVDLEIESLKHPERYPLIIKRNALDFVGL